MAISQHFEVGAGYEVENPPMLALSGEHPHQLSRFFTVLSTDDHGISIYDGWYGNGFSSLHLSHEVLEQLRVTQLPTERESVALDLAGAIASSATAAIEHRTMVAEHGGALKGEHASQQYFVQYLSGQVRGLASKGKINPDLAVSLMSLATGVGIAAGE